MKRRFFFSSGVLVALASTVLASEPRGSITIERIAAIKHPSDASWSPDGEQVAFLWDAAGNQNLFVVSPGKEPYAITEFAPHPDDLTGDIGGFEWVSSEEILFQRDGRLWLVAVRDREPRAPAGLEGVADFAVSPDREKLALVRDGGLWLAAIDGSDPRRILELEEGVRARRPVFSRDGRSLAFTTARIERVVDILPYNGNKQGLYRNVIEDYAVGIVRSEGGQARWLSIDGSPSSVQWTGPDSILFQRISTDMKTREIVVATFDGKTRTLRRDHDERWWSPIGRDARTVVSPDGTLVAFFANETGWTHLYVMSTDTDGSSVARQLTSGELEAGFGSWSPDGKRIAFYDNEASPMERFVRVVDVGTGTIESIVTEHGVNYWPRFSPDGRRLVFERTDVENSVDLYVADVTPDAGLTRLTRSMPETIDKADLTAPEPVYFPSRVDARQVPGSLFVPKGLDRSRKHPAIVWIHGSGSDQNFLGWHPFSYRMYYSATQYLVQQGYIVLTVDYRGSSGYGRDWGTGHHLDLGGPDALDVASGADYLKTLAYIDGDRIGVWGLSYGGFLTLQVLTRTPSLFRCGIDVAGVTDWATWGLESNGRWITGRMSTPEANAEGYVRTASIKHMETLERPLLILHGTADVNVAFRESLNLIDVLLKQGKDFDFEVYPGELHFFRREHILRDAWRRAELFFDTHLRNGERLESN